MGAHPMFSDIRDPLTESKELSPVTETPQLFQIRGFSDRRVAPLLETLSVVPEAAFTAAFAAARDEDAAFRSNSGRTPGLPHLLFGQCSSLSTDSRDSGCSVVDRVPGPRRTLSWVRLSVRTRAKRAGDDGDS